MNSGARTAFVLAALLLAGCATRPVNPPLAQFDRHYGYRVSNWQAERGDPGFGLVVAMSGGGTRAAAFSFGILEELKRTAVPSPRGTAPLLDKVNFVTGVSGGSFTALAYALHGDRLFEEYERRFLKRDVQGDLAAMVLNPTTWPTILGGSFTRSDMAAEYYDRILFEGATFGDLRSRGGPFVNVAATEVTTGARITFNQRSVSTTTRECAASTCARTWCGRSGRRWPMRRRAGPACAIANSPRCRTARRTATCTWSTGAFPTTWACAPCSRAWKWRWRANDSGPSRGSTSSSASR
ncbi:MAG: patatin-like phospholipase family protein [Betaproteobacteria bacterium]|nr:patatin-like phospholipase family protein [Betaproteobacteria bacterium]